MKITRCEEGKGWQLARRLTKRLHAVSTQGAFANGCGLKDKIQRASGSAMHNIAKGFEGGSNAEFVKSLRNAWRSCSKVQSQLSVAQDQAPALPGMGFNPVRPG